MYARPNADESHDSIAPALPLPASGGDDGGMITSSQTVSTPARVTQEVPEGRPAALSPIRLKLATPMDHQRLPMMCAKTRKAHSICETRMTLLWTLICLSTFVERRSRTTFFMQRRRERGEGGRCE